MGTYISMLRGINVGGQKKLKMDGLKKLYESLGFRQVQTYIQSGNVVFQCSGTDILKLTNMIEKSIKQSFGFEAPALIRTRDEFRKLIKNNPFSGKDAGKLHVTFLSNIPVHLPKEEINKAKGEAEEFSIIGREIYLFCPDGYGRSKLSNSFFARKLKLPATTRNWNTVNKLYAIAQSR